MRRATVVLLLMLTSVSVVGAEPVTLTVSGVIESAVSADAETHLGFPVFPGFPFVFSANLQPASPDQIPNPDVGLWYLKPDQLRFVFDPESFASEFTSRSGDTSDGTLSNQSEGDTFLFGIFTQTVPQFEFVLAFVGPASWLNSDRWDLAELTMPPILFASFSARCVTPGCGDGEPFMEGRVETIAVSPAPVPEPASIVLLGAGLLAMAAQRRLLPFDLRRRN